MIPSKAWQWENVTEGFWQDPSEQAYYLAARWQRQHKKTFLDLGCGIGRHALFFAQQGFSVDAFDLSEHGVATLQKTAAEQHLTIRAQVGDMLQLPYESGVFDCLMAYHTIYHTDRAGIQQVIAEIYRTLAATGEAYVTFVAQQNVPLIDYAFERVDANTLMPLDGQEAGIPHFFVEEQDVRQLLHRFEIVKLSCIENIWDDGRSWHYFVLIKKPC